MKPFKAIAAMSENRIIGAGGKIPWHIPEELAQFKHLTMGGVVVMGRLTWQSIGRPLPDRLTVVIASRPLPGIMEWSGSIIVTPSLDLLRAFAADFADKQFWIVGGARLFQDLLPECCELHLSRVPGTYEGDVIMPPFEHLFHRRSAVVSNRFTSEHWTRKI